MFVDGRFYSSCFLFGSDQMRGRYSVGNCDTICEELFFLVGITEIFWTTDFNYNYAPNLAAAMDISCKIDV